jgi:hypothetical protein
VELTKAQRLEIKDAILGVELMMTQNHVMRSPTHPIYNQTRYLIYLIIKYGYTCVDAMKALTVNNDQPGVWLETYHSMVAGTVPDKQLSYIEFTVGQYLGMIDEIEQLVNEIIWWYFHREGEGEFYKSQNS